MNQVGLSMPWGRQFAPGVIGVGQTKASKISSSSELPRTTKWTEP